MAIGSKSTNIITFEALHIPGGVGPNTIEGSNSVFFGADIISVVNEYSPSWSEEGAYGKMDPMAFYGNTSRRVSIKFTTIANEDNASQYSARKLSERVDKLVTFQYPRYSNSAIAAPPLFKIGFYKEGRGGNAGTKYTMFDSFTGYMNTIKIDPGSSAITVGSDRLTPTISDGYLIERGWVIDVQVGVLHDIPPGWDGSSWSGTRLFSFSTTSTSPPGGAAAPATPAAAVDPNTPVSQQRAQAAPDTGRVLNIKTPPTAPAQPAIEPPE